jgi:hypothetical protein
MAHQQLTSASAKCTRCGQEKPRTNEFFGLFKKTPDGLLSRCRLCINLGWRDNNHRHYPERGKRICAKAMRNESAKSDGLRYFACAVCRVSKLRTVEFFHPNDRCFDGLRLTCRECLNGKARVKKEPEITKRAKLRSETRKQRREDRIALLSSVGDRRLREHSAEHKRAITSAKLMQRENRRLAKDGLRTCTGCRETKPLTSEFFTIRSDTGKVRAQCNLCRDAWYKEYWKGEVIRRRCTYELRADDPVDRLRLRMSAGIRHALHGKKDGQAWEQMVGYTRSDLANHLERQFTKGMSWDNMGKWHIDHIVPLSSFKFASAKDPEFRAAWALTNLRPLWGRANIQKGDRNLYLI